MTDFCIRCDRLFCQHTGARYQDDRFQRLMDFGPVTTTVGETARQRALAILEPRHAALDTRSRTEFRFSEIELQHRDALSRTIATLHGMAPTGELLPASEPGRLIYAVT